MLITESHAIIFLERLSRKSGEDGTFAGGVVTEKQDVEGMIMRG